MPQPLLVHPMTPCAPELNVHVGAAWTGGGLLALSFAIFGPLDRLYLPPLGDIVGGEALWRRTCFEAFVQAEGEEGYVELNFAPTGAWAAYRFTGYRAGMTPATAIGTPRIDVLATETLYELRATIDLGAGLAAGEAWRLGLSAVIEETDGDRSYWALAHHGDKPDFHHSQAFALALPRSESA